MVDAQTLREEVLRRSCERLGYADTFQLDGPCVRRVDILQAGGGFLAWPQNARKIDELHVFPHGGIECPQELTPYLSIRNEKQLAKTIWDNYDTGTPSVAAELFNRLSYPGRVARMLAFFRVSRALVDANRQELLEQVPRNIYRGNLPLKRHLCRTQRESIVRDFVAPWLQKLKIAIRHYEIPVVFHHHTYDEKPNPKYSAVHVVDAEDPRPTAMLFQNIPVKTAVADAQDGDAGGQLLEPELLLNVRNVLQQHLSSLTDKAEVTVDRPYTLPHMPLVPTATHSSAVEPRNFYAIVYELRKDLFASVLNVPHIVDAVDHMSAIAQDFVKHSQSASR